MRPLLQKIGAAILMLSLLIAGGLLVFSPVIQDDVTEVVLIWFSIAIIGSMLLAACLPTK